MFKIYTTYLRAEETFLQDLVSTVLMIPVSVTEPRRGVTEKSEVKVI